jgi:hypothetical protein
MSTLLQLTAKRDAARAALASATPKTRARALAAYDSATLAVARFNSRLAAKSRARSSAKDEDEDDDDKEEEEEEDEEEEADDEPKKPMEEKKSKGKAKSKAEEKDDDEDDDSDDDDSDDDEDDDDGEEEDEEEDEDEEEEEDEKEEEDEEARSKALASARSVLRAVKRTGSKAALASARSNLASVKRAIRPKALGDFRTLRAVCQRVTGQRSVSGILGALEALASTAKSTEKLSADVSKLKADKRRSRVDAMLAEARREQKITAPEMKSLRAQGLNDPKWLRGHLAILPKKVRSLEDGGLVGRTTTGGKDGDARREDHLDAQSMTAEERKIILTTASQSGKSFDEFVADMNKTRAKALSRPL